jgi:hypothetical protein
MDYTFELNNARKDDQFVANQINAKSPVVEVFSAMADGKELSSLKLNEKIVNKASEYILGLAKKAEIGDLSAMAEINTIRKFNIEPKLLQEIKLLSIFGSYKPLGWNETPEVETYKWLGVEANQQAEGTDVTFPTYKVEKYPIAPVTISGGYAVNYRELALGDFARENEGMEEVRKTIRNNAALYVIKTVFDKVENATGVKYFYEASGLAKTGVDALLTKIRRYGKPTVIGDYAVLAQFIPWVGYVGTIGTSDVIGVSQKILDEIADTGLVGSYMGSILSEIPNSYNYNKKNTIGDNYDTLLPAGLAFVVPAGQRTSAIQTFTQGGLTSMTGNDVTTGTVMTRFDLAVAADVAKGREDEIAIIHDSSLDNL